MRRFAKRTAAAVLSASMLFTNAIFAQATETETAEFPQTIAVAIETAEQLMEALNVTGMTMAIVDAETGFAWTRGFGYADSVNEIPADEDTLFQVGSLSKTFTAIAVMQLVEQGIIDLDEPLVTYIPEFSLLPNSFHGGDSDNITIRMLLSNTSGVISNWNEGFLTTGEEHYQGYMNNLLVWLPDREMSFVEGTEFEYSNNNWVLLGILVAEMTGYENYLEGFTEYVEENILAPLGMDMTSFLYTSGLTNYAMPHLLDSEMDVLHLVGPISAGSLHSSANEMVRFMNFLLNGGILGGERLLQEKTITYMMQKHTGNVEMSAPFMGYGLGFMHKMTDSGFETVGHAGNIIHYHTDMVLNPESGLGVFVSTNSLSGAAIVSYVAYTVLQSAVMEKTGELPLLEPFIELAGEPVELEDDEIAALAELEGSYSFGSQGIWDLLLVEDVLTYVINGMEVELAPMSDGSFDSIAGRFLFETSGDEVSVLLTNGFIKVQGEKLNDITSLLAPEGFEEWVGTYNFTPKFENEVSVVTQLIVFVSDLGIPMMSMVSHTGAPTAQLTLTDGRWFMSSMLVRFLSDDNVGAFIDLMGGEFVKQ